MSGRMTGAYVCDRYQTDLPCVRRSHPYAPPRAWVRPATDETQGWTYVFRLMRGGFPIYYGHSRDPVAYVKNLREHPSGHPFRPIAQLLGEFRTDKVPVLIEILAALWADPRDYSDCVDRIMQHPGEDLGGKMNSTERSDCHNPL